MRATSITIAMDERIVGMVDAAVERRNAANPAQKANRSVILRELVLLHLKHPNQDNHQRPATLPVQAGE